MLLYSFVLIVLCCVPLSQTSVNEEDEPNDYATENRQIDPIQVFSKFEEFAPLVWKDNEIVFSIQGTNEGPLIWGFAHDKKADKERFLQFAQKRMRAYREREEYRSTN